MSRIKGSKKGVTRYPVFYHIRVTKETIDKLKKMAYEGGLLYAA